jgi:hypothetical protein
VKKAKLSVPGSGENEEGSGLLIRCESRRRFALPVKTEGHQRLLDRSGLFRLSPRHPQHTQDRQQKEGRRHDKDEVIVAASPFHDVAVDRRPGHGCQLGGDVIQPRVGSQVASEGEVSTTIGRLFMLFNVPQYHCSAFDGDTLCLIAHTIPRARTSHNRTRSPATRPGPGSLASHVCEGERRP